MNARPPMIGLPVQSAAPARAQFTMLRVYGDAIVLGGGLPVFVPLIEDESTLRPLYDRLDGVCLVGGGDVAPTLYASARPELANSLDPPRDTVEGTLCRWALAEGKPLLAICRGIQMLNVAAGGALYEDIATLAPGALPHTTPAGLPPGHIMHTVAVEAGSLLARWLGEEVGAKRPEQPVGGEMGPRSGLFAPTGIAPDGLDAVPVNSRHHQAIRALAPGLRVTARAPDGIIEAVEAGTDGQIRAVGVQWHPECMLPDDAAMRRLFVGFCALCADGAR
jgi:putative glutamine amidotransferase